MSSRAQEQKKSREGSGWLGTWANRQVHYSKAQQPQPSLPAHIPGTPQPSSERWVLKVLTGVVPWSPFNVVHYLEPADVGHLC